MLGQSWRNERETGNYPFADSIDLLAGGNRTIGPGVFVDAAVCVTGGVAPLYLSRIEVSGTDVTFWIGDENEQLMASGTYIYGDENAVIQLTDIAGRPGGILVSESERLSKFNGWDSGNYDFDATQTMFAARATICPPLQGVSTLRDNTGQELRGDVWLVGDQGVLLRWVDNAIRVDVIGDPLFRRRLCGGDGAYPDRTFVKHFAGLAPNTRGDLGITVEDNDKGSIIRVISGPSGIEISTVGG
jgi:hypothetical protein